MTRVFIYELRRQIINKLFLGIFATCLLYAWATLTTSVIRGVDNTAPFSLHSFVYYIQQVMPLMIIALLICVWTIYSPTNRRVRSLMSATPVNKRSYEMLKCGAALVSWLIIPVCVILLGLVFLVSIFGNAVPVVDLLKPCAAMLALPAALCFFIADMLAVLLK